MFHVKLLLGISFWIKILHPPGVLWKFYSNGLWFYLLSQEYSKTVFLPSMIYLSLFLTLQFPGHSWKCFQK